MRTKRAILLILTLWIALLASPIENEDKTRNNLIIGKWVHGDTTLVFQKNGLFQYVRYKSQSKVSSPRKPYKYIVKSNVLVMYYTYNHAIGIDSCEILYVTKDSLSYKILNSQIEWLSNKPNETIQINNIQNYTRKF